MRPEGEGGRKSGSRRAPGRLVSRRPAAALLLAVALLAPVPPPVATRAEASNAVPPFPGGISRTAPGQILVIGRAPAAPAGLPGRGSLAPLEAPGALSGLSERAGLGEGRWRPLAAGSRTAALAFPGGAWVLSYSGGEDPAAAAFRVAADPSVAYAGPNHLIPLAANAAVRAAASGDSLYARQYALAVSRVPAAWARTRGAGVMVAVIDTGVQLDHPDLAGQFAVNAAEANGAPGVDDDGNGYVDDVWGYDFTDAPDLPGAGDYLGRDPDPTDDQGHGTEVAGVIAAAAGNGRGIAGVAPEARILAVRAGFRTSVPLLPALLEEDDAAAGILYAVDRGAQVINLSWGDGVPAALVEAAVAYAQSRDVVVVASAGNTPGDRDFYPSAHLGVLSAGASDRYNLRAAFSTYGQDLDVLAPGVAVLTTALGGGYTEASGTSFSAPMTAGTAALVRSAFPGWSAEETAWRIRLAANGAADGFDPLRGYGALDAEASVAPGPPPPVAGIERMDPAPGGWTVTGTVSDRRLLRWSLSAAPVSGALTAAPAPPGAPLPGERELGSGTTQVVAESLGTFTAAPGDTGEWVARLRSWGVGRTPVEKRVRFRPPITPAIPEDLVLDLQAAVDGGWDLMATWSSTAAYQGGVRLDFVGAAPRTAREYSSRTNHTVRVPGPLPEGTGRVVLTARGDGRPQDQAVGVYGLAVPAAVARWGAESAGPVPAGTPMARTVDWNGDGRPEILLEEPAGGDLYGSVERVEAGPGDSLTVLDSSEGIFQGIPIDAGDPDGDGLADLAVYRFDGWSVWEARAPGAFPSRRVAHAGSGDGVPVAFVTVAGGGRLLVVAGGALRVYRADPVQGYVLAGSAADPAGGILNRGAAASASPPGTVKAAFPTEAGAVALFAIDSTGVRFLSEAPAPESPVAAATVPRSDGGRDLVTAGPHDTGSDLNLNRGAVVVRRWRWSDDGGTAVSVSRIAFTGYTDAGDLQLVPGPGPDRLLLRRGEGFDALAAAGDTLRWDGHLADAAVPSIGGAVAFPAAGRDYLWAGASVGPAPGGDRRRVLPAGPRITAPSVRVVEAAETGAGLAVRLAWDATPCGDALVLRNGNVRGGGAPSLDGTSARDTVVAGETVTYRILVPGCVDRELTVTGSPIARPSPVWVDRDRVALDFPRPLAAPPERVEAWAGGRAERARAAQLDRGGTRLLVTLPEAPAESLIVIRAWDVAGLPVGGSVRWAAALPAAPEAASPLHLLAAVYRNPPGAAPYLAISLSGPLPDSCESPFRLDPTGWDLAATPDPGIGLRLELPRALEAGVYALSLDGACAGLSPDAPGLVLEFRVGLGIYPNPVGPSQPLTVENAPEGARVRLLDLTGRLVAAWEPVGATDSHLLPPLAPGLYLLRVEDRNGRTLRLEKVALVR